MNYMDMALHTDKYQINMQYAHWKNGTHNNRRVFEVYFRRIPFGNGYAVFAGLERVVHYINNLKFTDDDIAYLAEQEENYDRAFLEELHNFKFNGNIYSVKEGALVFPNEPLMVIEARVFEAQLIETAILNFMNYQTLIATKAARIRQVAPEDILMEFGTRRAQEADAAVWGARAAYIAGFNATSNMAAGKAFGIPTKGTHAHAWVQDHSSEIEAFRQFAFALPDNVTLLVDTYDTLRSGVPNAIKVAKELKEINKTVQAIRLDSGDLSYLSREARKLLDEAGLEDVKIVASNDLDEHTILNLKNQGAKIDSWGIGTQLITASDQPALGGVYKMVAKEENGQWLPTIKISGNPEKITTPGYKTLYRMINKGTNKAVGDYVSLIDEQVKNQEKIKLFHPVHTWLHKNISNFDAVKMLEPVFKNGQQIYELPNLEEVRRYHDEQLNMFWPEYLRLLNPEVYHVNLSQQVYDMKIDIIQKEMQKIEKD